MKSSLLEQARTLTSGLSWFDCIIDKKLKQQLVELRRAWQNGELKNTSKVGLLELVNKAGIPVKKSTWAQWLDEKAKS